MPTIVVNTAADTIANDGKTSLREAVAQAAGMKGHVDIVFDTKTFWNGTAVKEIVLDKTLTITKGDIAIDGSLFYAGNSYGIKISGEGLSTNAITVEKGATVTLRDLTIHGSSSNNIKAKYGAEGHNGAHGSDGSPDFHDLPGIHGTPGNGVSGGHATDGGDAPNDAQAGQVAVGAILNRGNLTLERVDIQSFKTEGGAGGLGGTGGAGGRGGNGQNGTPNEDDVPVGTPGDGGNGGNSGDGATGGAGGDAVAGIHNIGTLTLRDVAFSGMAATGGKGGAGGAGWSGGHGGNSGESQVWAGSLELAHAGDGGNGGNGGNGGRGGVAAAALLNIGTVRWEGVQSGVLAASLYGGLGGTRGEGGREGYGGDAFEAFNPNDPRNGKDGEFAGSNGASGVAGGKGDFVGTSVKTGASFIVDAAKLVVSEQGDDLGRIVSIAARLMGGSQTGLKTVDWKITGSKGFSAADFETFNGKLRALSGTFEFNGSTTGTGTGFTVAKDSKAEGIESFTLTLSNPKGGVLGWSKSVTVYITDEAPNADGYVEGHDPTKVKLSKTAINENTKTNTKVGALSTTDADRGRSLHL